MHELLQAFNQANENLAAIRKELERLKPPSKTNPRIDWDDQQYAALATGELSRMGVIKEENNL